MGQCVSRSVKNRSMGQCVSKSPKNRSMGQCVSRSPKNRSAGKWVSRSSTILTVENAVFGSPGYRIDLKLILSKVLGVVGKILAVAT